MTTPDLPAAIDRLAATAVRAATAALECLNREFEAGRLTTEGIAAFAVAAATTAQLAPQLGGIELPELPVERLAWVADRLDTAADLTDLLPVDHPRREPQHAAINQLRTVLTNLITLDATRGAP